MKSLIAIALMTIAAPALAQSTPAPAPAAAPAPTAVAPAMVATPAAAAAKFSLDTPIEVLVADPAAHAVLTADFGGDITANPQYDNFKAMSFNQVQPYAPDKLPAALMTKIAADLAALK